MGTRIRVLAEATRHAHDNAAPLRHVLLFGPPGTGKTLVATCLAKHCGLDFAIMAGGDVAPLGPLAVTELNALFAWAKTSPRGMLLFIDESEAFLSSRSRGSAGKGMGEDARNALSALLAATGDHSPKLMLVLATNRPGDLDSAVTDRVDESIFLGAPDEGARAGLLDLYYKRHVLGRSAGAMAAERRPLCARKRAARPLAVASDVTPAFLRELASLTAGLSGRAIAKVMVAAQASAYGRPPRAQDGACVVGKQQIVDAVNAELEKLDRRVGPRKGGRTGGASPLPHPLPPDHLTSSLLHVGVQVRSPTSFDHASAFWTSQAPSGAVLAEGDSASFVVPPLGGRTGGAQPGSRRVVEAAGGGGGGSERAPSAGSLSLIDAHETDTSRYQLDTSTISHGGEEEEVGQGENAVKQGGGRTGQAETRGGKGGGRGRKK